MIRKMLFALCFVPYLALGQLSDNFERGYLDNWIQEPSTRWDADTASALNGHYSLHHIFNNTAAGTDLIGLPVENLHIEDSTVEWNFKVRHGYNPSSSNNWGVWIISSSSPSAIINNEPVSGYVVGVNYTGSTDTLKLWKVTNNSKKEILACPLNWEKNIGTNMMAEISISRDTIGNWTVSAISQGITYSGNGYDAGITETNWLVVNYKYSANYDQLLWIDDISIDGKFYSDTIPPTINNLSILSKNELEISFSEEVTEESLSVANFSIFGSDNFASSISTEADRAIITFENPFINKQHNILNINSVCDINNNCQQSLSIGFYPTWAEIGDVIITEIMADPSPSVALPEEEYLELFNRTEYSLDLSGWMLGKGEAITTIPSAIIDSGEHLVLCSITDTSLFSSFGKVCGVKSFPTLNDEGSIIYLIDNYGTFIHGVEYSSSWYSSNLKSSGGWALELIDTDYPFYYDDNWEASSDRQGGTPGKTNSSERTNRDEEFNGIINVFAIDEHTIRIDFSEPVTNFRDEYLETRGELLNSSKPIDSLRRSFVASMPTKMILGDLYTITLSDEVTDNAGNSPQFYEYAFGLTSKAIKGDISFNEILFNPLSGGCDFIELYNNSDKYINANELLLASINNSTGDTSSTVQLFPVDRCILPKSFFVVTTDSRQVIESYPENDEKSIFSISSLPSMPDDKGHILLMTKDLVIIDDVIYNEKMHYSLLKDVDGISLEKIRPGLPSNESSSWHSASEVAGFGTPGVINSAYFPGIDTVDSYITLSSTRVSPDNDGFEDILEIKFEFPRPDNVITIRIFSETGRLVRLLEDNTTVNNKGSFFWDGTLTNGSLVNNGIYILLIETFSSNGDRETLKKVCSVVKNH